MNKVYYNEYDKNKAAALRQLIKDGIISSGDVDDRPIQEVKSNDVKGYTRWHFFAGFGGWDIALQIAGWPANRPISTVSCPCQDYSTSGPKTRQQGQRHLWPYYARIATESGFPEIIGEQVDEAIAAGWTDDAFFDLEEKNYACAQIVFPTYSVEGRSERSRIYYGAYALGQRLQGPRGHKYAVNQETYGFGEANSFVDAVQGNALPFLCERHSRVRPKVCHVINHGIGDAIVPEQAAEFITAYMESRI